MNYTYPVRELEVDGFYVRDCFRAYAVEEGGVEESSGFVIKLGARAQEKHLPGRAHTTPCRHAKEIARKPFRYPGEGPDYQITSWVVPRLLEASNEGGHACTQVCLDCAVEAAAEIGK